MAACIAVISDTNQLLYIRTPECPDPLFYHFKVHSSLDVIEDKLSRRFSSTGAHHQQQQHQQPESYLGLLYPMEDHRLYGYVTNTRIKFVMVIECSPDQPVSTQRDSDVRIMFQRLHTAYVELTSSPFYTLKTPISPETSPAAQRFDRCVGNLLAPTASSGTCSNIPVPASNGDISGAAVPTKT